MANPVVRIIGFILAVVAAIGLTIGGIFGTRGMFKPQLTITPIAWTPTSTHTATQTPNIPSETPVNTPTPMPLWMLLEATYTPVPLYVNTPHPRVEAYRLAIRAFERGDFERMIVFLEQTLQDDPDAVDVHYYLGEAHRYLEEYEAALQHYDDALTIDPNFAPVYLSRALLRKSVNPRAEIYQDLSNAISRDPGYGEAYLERARYFVSIQEYQDALDDLTSAVELLPMNPYVYLELSEVNLAVGNTEAAIEHALKAHDLDITILHTYLVLGKAYLANDMPEEAFEKIKVYGSYTDDDPLYHAILGGVNYELGEDYEAALESLEKAKSLDDELAFAHFYHGLTTLTLNDPKQAVNSLYIARTLEPENPEYALWFGIALFEDGRFKDAYNLFDLIEPMVESGDLLPYYYYYMAKSGMELSLIEPVRRAWTGLLEIRDGDVPSEWIEEAEDYLYPPTNTPTFTATPSLSPSFTQTFTLTPSPTKTPSNTQTPVPTSMPTVTGSP
jgi:tetratricopeptide (TPR) repeat protein